MLSCADVQPSLIRAAFEPGKGLAGRSGHGLAREGKRSAMTCTSNTLSLCIEGQGASGVRTGKIQCHHDVSTAMKQNHSAPDVDDPASPLRDHLIDRSEVNRSHAWGALLLQVLHGGECDRCQTRKRSNRPKP